jgi:hypothetical protein
MHDHTATMNTNEDIAWLARDSKSAPIESLRRIKFMCDTYPDLFQALLLVLATHQDLPRDKLSLAIKQFRPDVQDLSPVDIAALLISIWNGGYPGFEAVLRNKRKKLKGASAGTMSWIPE